MDEIKRLFRDRIELYQTGKFNAQLNWEEFKKDILDYEHSSWTYKQKIVYSIIKARRVML